MDSLPQTMKAVQIERYGDNTGLQVNEIPVPHPADNEVLIKVASAGINPVDWKVRSGYVKNAWHHQLPMTLGWELAGTVVSVGTNVAGLQAGDAVFAYKSVKEQGVAYAEYAVLDEQCVAKAPQTMQLDQAGAVPLAALTAWQALHKANVTKGERVLIHAGSGGVGHFAIQIARHMGAEVVTTASAQNHDMLLGLGAKTVLDYRQPDHLQGLEPVDVVLDTLGGKAVTDSYSVMNDGGRVVSITAFHDNAAPRGIKVSAILVHPDNKALATIAQLIDRGEVKMVVSETLPLADAATALAHSQAGRTVGKIVLTV